MVVDRVRSTLGGKMVEYEVHMLTLGGRRVKLKYRTLCDSSGRLISCWITLTAEKDSLMAIVSGFPLDDFIFF